MNINFIYIKISINTIIKRNTFFQLNINSWKNKYNLQLKIHHKNNGQKFTNLLQLEFLLSNNKKIEIYFIRFE